METAALQRPPNAHFEAPYPPHSQNERELFEQQQLEATYKKAGKGQSHNSYHSRETRRGLTHPLFPSFVDDHSAKDLSHVPCKFYKGVP